MRELLQRNWSAIKIHQAKLYQSLRKDFEVFDPDQIEIENERFEWIPVTEGMNFRYTRQNPPIDVVYHQPNPVDEADLITSPPEIAGANFVLVLGTGLGYGIKKLLSQRTPHNHLICVFESNPQIFFRALCVQDFTEIFQDTTVHWFVDRDVAELGRSFYSIPNSNPTVIGSIAAIHQLGAMAAEGPFYSELKEEIVRQLSKAVSAFGNNMEDQMSGLENTIENMVHVYESPGFASLLDQFQGRTIISVASGPSLDGHWDLLREVQRKIPIIACDSAYPKLMEKGIIPDFVTALEREPYVAKYFASVSTPAEATLITPTMILRSACDAFKGSKAFYSGINRFCSTFSMDELGVMLPGHSAGNLNVSAACKMGFTKIILVGHNLAYAPGTLRSHYEGIGGEREKNLTEDKINSFSKTVKTICQDGTEEVVTDIDYDLFRVQMEHWIHELKYKITFINTAAKGARIAGTQTMTLKDAIQSSLLTPYNITHDKAVALGKVSEDVKAKRVMNALINTRKSIQSLSQMQQKLPVFLAQLDSRLGKIAEKEMEGKSVSIQKINEWLDDVLKFKISSVEDRAFQESFFSIFIPIHIQFERELNALPAKYKDEYFLKRDLLRIHRETYFEVWREFLPRILEKFKEAEKNLESLNSNRQAGVSLPGLHFVPA